MARVRRPAVRGGRVLMVYIEPAPYVVGLIDAVRSTWGGALDVVFIHPALTQAWGYSLREPAEKMLPSGTLNALRSVQRLLKSNNYSLLHLAGWGHPLLLGALLLASWHDIPTTIESDSQLLGVTPLWKRLGKELFYRWMFKLPKAFLPAGTRQAAYFRHFGVEESRIRVARMTVDVKRIASFSRSMSAEAKVEALNRYGIPKDDVKFLYLGRLEPQKGLSDLLDAFEQLCTQIEKVSLLIAGDGSMRKQIEARATPPIYYLDRLAAERVWEAYAISDVFVLPSHFEPWGLVVNEAMASGLPVIATERVGCSDDLVLNGTTGLIVSAESPNSLCIAMQALAMDVNARRRMGSAGRRIISDWTLEKSARDTVASWNMILA